MVISPIPQDRENGRIIQRMERLPLLPFHLRLAAVLGCGTFFDAYDALVISVIAVAVIGTFRVGVASVGPLVSAGYLGQIAGAFALGWLSERWGRKPTFVAALALMGVFSLASAFAWSYQSLLFARLAQGFGIGAEAPIAAALFSEYFGAKIRGRIGMLYETVFFITRLPRACLS